MPLAVSTGSSGRVAVWAVEPVELLSEFSPGDEAAVAVAWLEHTRGSSGSGDDTRASASTLLVCTRSQLLMYPLLLRGDGALPPRDDLSEDCAATVALPERVPEGATCTLHTIAGAGDSASILLHCSVEGARSRAVLFTVSELTQEPLLSRGVVARGAAAAECAAGSAHLARIHGARAMLGVSAAMPPALCVLAVGPDALEVTWTSGARAAAKATPAHAGHVLGAHASVPCGTAAVLCDFPGLPRKLSLWALVASGGRMSLVPEQMASVADATGDVHVMAVGLGRAAVVVAGSRSIVLWLRCTTGWAAAVRTPVPGTAHTLAATPFGLLAGLPLQLLLFEPTVDTPGGCVAIGGAAAAAVPPQPLWHPGTLLVLLLQGLHGVAAGLLRLALLHSRGLQQNDVPSALKHLSKGVLPLPTVAAAMLALAGHSFPAAPTRAARRHRGPPLRGAAAIGGAIAGARDRVAGLLGRPTTDSGTLDASAFSLLARPENPSSGSADMAASGQLNLAAFGMGPAAAESPDGSATSGGVDRSHFRAGPPQPQHVQSPLGVPAMAPHPRLAAQSNDLVPGSTAAPSSQHNHVSPAVGEGAVSDTMASGQVNLAAFGMAMPQPQQTMASPAVHSTDPPDLLASGQVDLAAFGMVPAQPEPPAAAVAPVDVTADQMASGQIDLSHFGMAPAGGQPQADPTESRPAAREKPRTSPAAPPAADPMATGMLDLAAFGMSPAPPTPAAGAAHGVAPLRAAQLYENPAYASGSAPGSGTSQAGEQGQPLGESTCDGSGTLNRAPSFEMHFPEPLMQNGTIRRVNGSAVRTPRLAPQAAGAIGEAVDVQPPPAGSDAASRALQALQQLEAHSPAANEQLSEQELLELRAAVLPRNGAAGAGAASTARSIISGPEGHALLRLAELVAFSGSAVTVAAQVQGLDVAGRRAVSAARAGAALLEAQWDSAASEAEASAAEAESQRSRRKPKMSLSQSALLAKLKGGSVVTAGDGSHMSHSAALSSIDVPHAEPLPGLGPEAVEEDAAEACAEAWGRMHVLPTMHGAALHWAFDSASPRALLESAMGQMPTQERGKDHDDPGASGMEAFFAVTARSGQHSPWTWHNFRRLGAALWLREDTDVVHAAEQIAKATYAARKDPYEVAMWYCAQGRRALLAGMLRSKGDARVADFLGRDFSQQQNRTAAAKNAHKLLSQHRYALAASFFLLAHDVPAALATCLEHLHDVQLAVMLARLVDASGAISAPPGSHGYRADLFAQLIAEDAAAQCALLRALLRRAADEEFTFDEAAIGAVGCGCRCVESHMGRCVASAGPLARTVGSCGAVQATDWLMWTLLCNMSPQHASSAPEVAGISAAAAQQALGDMASHAAHACEHVGNPTAAMTLRMRSLAAHGGSEHESEVGAGAPGLTGDLRRIALSRISGLHAQCMQSCISGSCMRGAADGAGASLLFADETPLLAQVQASRPIAAAAVAWHTSGHQEDLLRGICGTHAAELGQLQQHGLVPGQVDIAHSVSRAVGLATVVQENLSRDTAAHLQSAAARRALEDDAAEQGDGPLRADGSHSILTVGEKDAQVSIAEARCMIIMHCSWHRLCRIPAVQYRAEVRFGAVWASLNEPVCAGSAVLPRVTAAGRQPPAGSGGDEEARPGVRHHAATAAQHERAQPSLLPAARAGAPPLASVQATPCRRRRHLPSGQARPINHTQPRSAGSCHDWSDCACG